MWNLLQRIIGHTSAYQERFMRSKDPIIGISPQQLEAAKAIISPLIKKAFNLSTVKLKNRTIAVLNNKGKPVPYYQTILHPQYDLHLYLNLANQLKNRSNVQLIVEQKLQSQTNLTPFSSLPTWESLIHEDLNKHQELVKLIPDHPWSLYNAAKKELVDSFTKNQVMGYPQWLINDIDYRNIKNAMFLFQIEIVEIESIIYFFKNIDDQEIQIFIQKI